MRAIARRLAVAAVLLCGSAAPSLATPPAAEAHAWPPADVERVSFESPDGRTHVVRIHLSSPVEAFSADARAGRLEVVLYGAHLAPTVQQEGAEWPVESYRMAAADDRVTLSFRLAGGVDIRAAADPASDDLLLTFSDGAPSVAQVAGWGVVRERPARAGRPVARRPRPSFGARGEAPAERRPARTDPVPDRAEAPTPSWPARREPAPLPEPVRPDLPPPTAARPAPRPARPEPAPPARPAEPEPAKATPMKEVEPAPPQTPAAEPVPAEALEAEVPAASQWRLDTVVLDAGHGGHDYGARANGTSDKEVALGVVSRLGPMIERELGVRVVYTRDDDTFVELRERGRIANRAGGKLFISVHANAAGSPSASGTETFFLAASKSSNARSVMERENSVIELESRPELYEDFEDQGDILQAMAMSAYQEESQALARLIEGEFVASGRKSRGVKQGPFIVLWAASMPAVLVEAGFVSNPDEARFLKSDAGLDMTAEAIFRAVRAYKESYERGLRPGG